MADRLDRAMDDAFAMGRANQVTIELARRHCLDMTFTESGGRGSAEAMSGLPINMRQVSCPVAHGGMAMNLQWIASEFYEQHCVGCSRRRPTGQVPNLASVIEEEKARASAVELDERDAIAREHEAWEQRVDCRRAAAVHADPATVAALHDIAILDLEPGVQRDNEAHRSALARLTALVERAPDLFTGDLVALAVAMVEGGIAEDLLAPLRRLANAREDLAPTVLGAALAVLRRRAHPEAGRCVADLLTDVEAHQVDRAVVLSLVRLAGAPEHGPMIGVYRRITPAQDASGLRAAASCTPDAVVNALTDLLPRPSRSAQLIVPPGADGRPEEEPSDFDRTAAATAIRALAESHPAIAARLGASLIASMAVDSEHDDINPVGAAQRTLAVLLVNQAPGVAEHLEGAGHHGGEAMREHVAGVWQQTERLLDRDDRFREAGDPLLRDDQRRVVFDELVARCLARMGEDWGYRTMHRSASLLDRLAALEPGWAHDHYQSFLGAFLTALDRLDVQPASSLAVVDNTPAAVRALDASSRRFMIGATARELLSAVTHAAGTDTMGVCTAITTLIGNERDTERGTKAVWRLLKALGEIGARHGGQPRVLRAILPTLHTYIVDTSVLARIQAIAAWTLIGSSHDLPSSLADLLPALLTDQHLGVIEAVLDAAMTLRWTEQERTRLVAYAVTVCQAVDAEVRPEALEKALAAIVGLTRNDDPWAGGVEPLVLRHAAQLDAHTLEKVLDRSWSDTAAVSPQMAALRLRQARDPQINDRFNDRGDKQLCALLRCGTGLVELPTEDLTDAALSWPPQYLLPGAEYAEVAWRAGRASDAEAIIHALRERMPHQPAYDRQRAFAHLLIAAARLDQAGPDDDLKPLADTLAAAIPDVGTDSDITAELVRPIRAAACARLLLADTDAPGALDVPEQTSEPGHDPSEQARARAMRIKAAARELAAAAQRATPTAQYLRAFAALCEIGAHLLQLDAAELDADADAVRAQATAIKRRVDLLRSAILRQFTETDPLAAPLLAALEAAVGATGADAQTLLYSWSRLTLPALIVRGPRRFARPTPRTRKRTRSRQPVAVALASLDGQLIAGPQVLRPNTAYALSVEVRPGSWPDWADRLEGEFITHFTSEEAETPIYRWHRSTHPNPQALVGEGTLILRFGLPAGRPAQPFLLALRWRGTREGQPYTETLDVTGHRELRFRPYDASRDALTKHPSFDERLLKIYESLHSAGYNEDHVQAFCRLFTAICRASLAMTWGGHYKRGVKVSERTFHNDLDSLLRRDPELGGRVERGTRLALGFLDVRHDGITAELKVSPHTAVTRESAPKYIGQPTQYAAADGARLSILCILDMSKKTLPAGTAENYVFTLDPRQHGLDNPEAPSVVAVIIVNGNYPPPSRYSRSRTPLRQPPAL